MPATVIRGARTHLARLDHFSARRDGDLFAARRRRPPIRLRADSSLRDRLTALDPDALSPRDAHEMLYELKRLADDA